MAAAAKATADCPKCGSGSRYPASLRKHLLTHAESAQERCPRNGCGRRLKTRYTLRVHIATQHDGKYPPRLRAGFRTAKRQETRRCNLEQQLGAGQRAVDEALRKELARLAQRACQAMAAKRGTEKTGRARCLGMSWSAAPTRP
jgi:hypothetical protein